MKYGRLPVKPVGERFAIGWAHDYLITPLAPPVYPVDVRGGAGPGPMWGNGPAADNPPQYAEGVGDCGECGVAFIELYTAWRAAVTGYTPQTDPAAIAEYMAYTGGKDSGVNLADFLLWLYNKGRIKAFAPLPHFDRLTCDAMMQRFRTPLYCGVSLTNNDEPDFGVRPWGTEGVTPNPQLGHCVDKVFSDGTTLEEWRTWAAFQQALLAWGVACLDEAWMVATTEEQLAQFDPQLIADLQALPGYTGPKPTPTPAPVPAPPPPAPAPPAPTPAPKPAGPGCLSLRALTGNWGVVQTADAWTFTLEDAKGSALAGVNSAWFTNALVKTVGAFLLGFLPLLAVATTSGVSVATLKAAAFAGLAAAAAALDTLVGNAINPTSTSVHAALRTRYRAAKVRRAERPARPRRSIGDYDQ